MVGRLVLLGQMSNSKAVYDRTKTLLDRDDLHGCQNARCEMAIDRMMYEVPVLKVSRRIDSRI